MHRLLYAETGTANLGVSSLWRIFDVGGVRALSSITPSGADSDFVV